MKVEKKKLGNITKIKDKDFKDVDVKDVKAFINKTRIQNEALKKIIWRLNKNKK
ncbi:MAG: hypothetical protein KAH25_07000 [Bacteroidales bacterium]|nr:hypothetical protein [Bacteroidales bacterium]